MHALAHHTNVQRQYSSDWSWRHVLYTIIPKIVCIHIFKEYRKQVVSSIAAIETQSSGKQINAHPTSTALLFLFVTGYLLDRSRELMTFEPIKQSSHTSSDNRSESGDAQLVGGGVLIRQEASGDDPICSSVPTSRSRYHRPQ